MRKHAQAAQGSHPSTQLTTYFNAIADTLEWNPDAWRILCDRLRASGTPVGNLTLRQIHDCLRKARERDRAPAVLAKHPRHPQQPDPEDIQSAPVTHRPTTPEATRARVSADITLHISEDNITLSGALDMGGLLVSSARGWRRIEDGWTLTSGPMFFRDHEDLLGHELAEYLGNLPLPLTLADALQEPRGGDDEAVRED